VTANTSSVKTTLIPAGHPLPPANGLSAPNQYG